MKIGVIDIGSNSVRLMLSEKGETLEKTLIITKLGEGLALTHRLNKSAIARSAQAVLNLMTLARKRGAEKVVAFATAAVRESENKSEFLSAVKELTGINIEVISGENEALLGILGALNGNDGAVIDIGGASTEITIARRGAIVYSKSVKIGTVRLLDLCGQDEEKLTSYIKEKIKEFGLVPQSNFFGIGGTATSLAAIALSLEVYDAKKIDGYKLTKESISKISADLIEKSVEERKKIKGLQEARAEVIAGGAILLKELMNYLGADEVTVSEKDNLEGYLETMRVKGEI